MYWVAALILIAVAIGLVGLIGIWPIAIPFVLIVGFVFILGMLRSGKEGTTGSASAIDRPPQPTGEPRAPSGEQRGDSPTANERTGQE